MSSDPDASRRQAISKISNALMLLVGMVDCGSVPEQFKEQCEDLIETLTKARFMLVEHEEPEGLLDELAQL